MVILNSAHIFMENFKLGLYLPTDPRWVDNATKNIADILIDHAYCEQKAALACVSLIVQFPEKKELRDALMPVVSEEWGHFRSVVAEMDKRNIAMTEPRKDLYVSQLAAQTRKGGSRNTQLCERLFVNALIEARSCERFRLLAQELPDEALRCFYHDLMVAEAGHYKLFLKLAKIYSSEAYVKERWQQWLDIEAQIIQHLHLTTSIHG